MILAINSLDKLDRIEALRGARQHIKNSIQRVKDYREEQKRKAEGKKSPYPQPDGSPPTEGPEPAPPA